MRGSSACVPRGAARGVVDATAAAKTAHATAVTRYTGHMAGSMSISCPASSGPAIAANWKMPLWYVTTFWKIECGAISGR